MANHPGQVNRRLYARVTTTDHRHRHTHHPQLEAEGGPDTVFAVVSHGDVIKAITADALGMHLDTFQRLSCDPCSVTVIRYTSVRPFVLRVNDVGGSVDSLLPPPPSKRRTRRSTDAVVGGGAGS